MEAFVRLSFLLVCFATSSAAAPTDSNGYQAITGSADAWASLVANVVPLLILIGEKHVKAYFKCISQRSQLFLYAASPIGLVTAMVTMVRLGNSPLMKRLIGRQFESRAEVLADVSSISGGNIGFELRGPRRILEQTINPNPNDEAHFWVQARKFGTGDEGVDFGAKVEAVVQRVSNNWIGVVAKLGPLERFRNQYINAFMVFLWNLESHFRDLGHCPYEENSAVTTMESASTALSRRNTGYPDENAAYLGGIDNNEWTSEEMYNASRICKGTVLIVFDANGEDAMDFARSHVSQTTTAYTGPRGPVEAGLTHAICTSKALAYLSWPDVSETLTTNANVKFRRLRISRNMAAVTCLLINSMLTTLNWFVTQSIMTTTFISLGLAGSCLTSFWTAVLVSRSTSQEAVSLEDIHPFRAGFRSHNFPRGVGLGYCPKQVIASVERDTTSQYLALERHDWITPASVVLTALAFILLYLGLRGAEWWVPFAMFGNVAFATCMRAILTTNSPLISSDWDQDYGVQGCPDPFSRTEHNWLLHLWRDLQPEGGDSALNERPSKRNRLPVLLGAVGATKRGMETESTPEGPEASRPTPMLPKQSAPNSDIKQEDGAKLIDVSKWSKDHWTVLSTYDKGARANLTTTGETLGAERDEFVNIVYAVAFEMKRRNLVVTEQDRWVSQNDWTLDSPKPAVEFVRSEFISRNGIWQQSLEIAVTRSAYPDPHPRDTLVTLLRAWAVEALLGGGALSKSKSHDKISHIDHESWEFHSVLHLRHNIEAIQEVAMEDFWNNEDWRRDARLSFTKLDPSAAHSLTTGFWCNRWMLWMAVKILFALMRLRTSDYLEQNPLTEDWKQRGREWIPGYVGFLEAVELLEPRSTDAFAMASTHQGDTSPGEKSMDQSTTDNVQGERATQLYESWSHCNTTNSERRIPPQVHGYTSYG